MICWLFLVINCSHFCAQTHTNREERENRDYSAEQFLYQLSKGLKWHEVEGEVVLFRDGNEKFFFTPKQWSTKWNHAIHRKRETFTCPVDDCLFHIISLSDCGTCLSCNWSSFSSLIAFFRACTTVYCTTFNGCAGPGVGFGRVIDTSEGFARTQLVISTVEAGLVTWDFLCEYLSWIWWGCFERVEGKAECWKCPWTARIQMSLAKILLGISCKSQHLPSSSSNFDKLTR